MPSRRLATRAFFAAALNLSTSTVRGQQAVWNLDFGPSNPSASYWAALADVGWGFPLGDLNGDGVSEVAASGSPLVLDGASGAVI